MELYGTYLTYLVKDELSRIDKALSVKEIALVIHIYPSKREQYNFERRIRASLKVLTKSNVITIQPERLEEKNIFITKYKSNGL